MPLSFSAEEFAKALEAHDFDFRVGSTVKGVVVACDTDGATIDIGGKSAAFMPIGEAAVKAVSNLDDILEPGLEYSFQVIRDQDADGQVLLSLRRLQLQQLWEKLAQMAAEGIVLDTKVTGFNRGGVTVDVEGLRGFVPKSHLSRSYESLEDLVGQRLTVSFLEVNQANNKLVMSERIAARNEVMGRLELGQLVAGTIVSLKPFGVFVEFDGVTGLLHIKQISKNYVESLSTLFQVGQPLKAVVVALDEDRNRISLSTKVLEKYPGEIMKEPETLLADAENRVQNVSQVLAESEA